LINTIALLFYMIIGFFLFPPNILADTISSEIISTPELVKTLQSGGHIIYMRHGPTNLKEKDTDRGNIDDCSRQRNLSVKGRELVKHIGSIFLALKIPVGEVSSSPYCRCKDTAKLTFGKFKIEPDLQFSISKNKKESEQLGERLFSMMMNSKTDDRNRVFVGHTSNLKDGLGIWPKPEGTVVVFQKRENKIIYKGMITPDAWSEF
jgi:phosphohistidine phosphatase SixA